MKEPTPLSRSLNVMRKSTRSALFLIFSLLTLSGCQSYTAQSGKMVNAWRIGNLEEAVAAAQTEAEKRAAGRDALIWRLEEGTVKRGAGMYEESNYAFELAEEAVERWEEEAKVKVATEARAAITNQATLPYRGRSYDKIMMNTYQALNYLQMNNLDAARVQLNRALQRQRDAVAENARRIEEAEEEARLAQEGQLVDEEGKATEAYDVELAQQDEQLSTSLEAYMGDLESKVLAYADYVNPFAVFLDGLVFSLAAYDSSDLERGRLSFARVAAMAPSRYMEEDLLLVEQLANGESPPALTYVIYETGIPPEREEIRIDIPLFIVSESVSYVGASFPKLRFYPDSCIPLVATAGGESHNTALVSNMDSVIALDFKNEWPVILTKTLASTAAKAIAAYFLEESVADQGLMAKMAVKVAVVAYQASMNRADLRSWMTLPREFQYCRFPTPEDRQVEIALGAFTESVTLDPGHISIIYVQGVSPASPPRITQFALIPETSQLASAQ